MAVASEPGARGPDNAAELPGGQGLSPTSPCPLGFHRMRSERGG